MYVYLRALAVWLLIIACEAIHGTLRTLFLAPVIGDFPARQVSVFTGIVIIFTIAWFTHRWMMVLPKAAASPSRHSREGGNPASLAPITSSTRTLWHIGAMWVLLTVVFEVTLGLLLGLSWQRILEDYDLRNGGLMLFGLMAMFATPWVVARIRK